ncbi:nicotinate-nucleotide adenylyltransferase [Aestuariivirga litoralis]|uniref:nicotinate-nucleotide adenylyltransferase n=1 Tax=Aestuariivirga litoralis TaxID=2650924 RepID=UPI0018C5EFED|nr:nicotinate-nucleotide adenylyltransferase [Aestuariivirga litoralis]MBG1233537.1 nicotinate-nucleotide adenylyltransferase [Aestuariivirga litoralis]
MLKLPPHGPQQRIGLFGGSFNPAHEGHRQVALYAMKRLQLDWVWWLVSPQNPLKSSAETSDYAERMALTKFMANHPRFVVTDIEKQIGSRYTAETLRVLKQHSDAEFIWIMGADSLGSLSRWYQWTEIMGDMQIAVLARPGYSIRALSSKAAIRYQHKRIPGDRPQALGSKAPPRWVFISMPLRKESSTALRAVAKPFHAASKFW